MATSMKTCLTLCVDYPEPALGTLLDLLWKPQYGAALQVGDWTRGRMQLGCVGNARLSRIEARLSLLASLMTLTRFTG